MYFEVPLEFSNTSTEQTKARIPSHHCILPPPSLPQVTVDVVGDVTCKHDGTAEGVGVGGGASVDGVAADGVAADGIADGDSAGGVDTAAGRARDGIAVDADHARD